MEWFTSDQHFNHKHILTMGKGRPFKTVEEMEVGLIDRWNKKVGKEDTVYILGDFCWGLKAPKIKDIMSRLNGNKILIIGNHDRIDDYFKTGMFVDIVPYKEIRIGKDWICLNHTPIFEWNGYYYGSYHFYGHTHGTLNLAKYTNLRKRPNWNCWDVGVDNNNYEPVSFEEIKEKIRENMKRVILDDFVKD